MVKGGLPAWMRCVIDCITPRCHPWRGKGSAPDVLELLRRRERGGHDGEHQHQASGEAVMPFDDALYVAADAMTPHGPPSYGPRKTAQYLQWGWQALRFLRSALTPVPGGANICCATTGADSQRAAAACCNSAGISRMTRSTCAAS